MGAQPEGATRLITFRLRLSRIITAVKISIATARPITVRPPRREASQKPHDIIAVSDSEFRMLSPT